MLKLKFYILVRIIICKGLSCMHAWNYGHQFKMKCCMILRCEPTSVADGNIVAVCKENQVVGHINSFQPSPQHFTLFYTELYILKTTSICNAVLVQWSPQHVAHG